MVRTDPLNQCHQKWMKGWVVEVFPLLPGQRSVEENECVESMRTIGIRQMMSNESSTDWVVQSHSFLSSNGVYMETMRESWNRHVTVDPGGTGCVYTSPSPLNDIKIHATYMHSPRLLIIHSPVLVFIYLLGFLSLVYYESIKRIFLTSRFFVYPPRLHRKGSFQKCLYATDKAYLLWLK